MSIHSDIETRVPALRYHTLGEDNLYRPIAFVFVTEKMCSEILAERSLILSITQKPLHARQRRLFAKYNPKQSAKAFHAVLRLYALGSRE